MPKNRILVITAADKTAIREAIETARVAPQPGDAAYLVGVWLE